MLAAGTTADVEAGREADAGSYKCRGCGMRFGLDGLEEMPRCPQCGGTTFRRAPLFDPAAMGPEPTEERPTLSRAVSRPRWLEETRAMLADAGRYLVYEDGTAIRTVPIPVGWSRIGRSASCDIRLDDPTVSRRHAIVVRAGGGRVRILDDRSLNGVGLNGERVEWGSLADGDELEIGRFRLYLVAVDAGSASEDDSSAGFEPAGSSPGSERAARSS